MTETFYKEILNSVSDGIYFLNTERTITYWSKGAEKLAGYSAAEIEGKSCKDNLLRHVDEEGADLCENGCPLEATMLDGKIREAEVFMHHKLGHRVLIRVKSFPLKNELGQITGAAEIFTEVNEKTDLAYDLELLRQEAMTDPLTGMANRRYMDQAAVHFEESIKHEKQSLGVLFVDIDNFKSVNDRFGHDTGDKALTMVAKTMLSALRPTDIASRWGGEEFVIFVPHVDAEKLGSLAERIRKLIELSWIDTEKASISVTASIGGTIVKPNETICSAIKRADEKAYLCKQSGRNCIHIDK
ncbi:sensor domain-containing diguanylate cyclase [Maridesulfovibrio salexigens]|uniref:Diguanylate cyclase with PAS/PAC sensor n=1 Tax=Maridesulfovibrio salexigens (strain ATCC 14822 / DSM 2638 / NCIMB 8403 / VKM B-1763) TaxID=526222 RepID=C6BSQ9_MARSD|nr:GGDEF domain-containing protein [Maridesulfovibrio salexigens]ACS81515.1 diguanylate cyclase with PAS/PAC sensor [Maridesulfovibrio salexigens DSM 2638]